MDTVDRLEALRHVGEAEELWTSCTTALRSQLPDPVWTTCFQPTTAVELTDDVLVVAVPSTLVKERIEARFLPQLHATLAGLGQHELDVVLQVRPAEELFPGVGGVDEEGEQPFVPVSTAVDRTASERASLNPRYTFENFVTGASNRFAHAAALAVAETPARSYNPLFIYGVAGLGKTHLLHAIAHYVKQNYPAYKVRYVSTETFLNDYVEGIRTNSMPEFKRKYRENDVLLVDDIQFMENKEGLQEEFFHTFNQLHAANRQIVLSSDRPPRAIATLEDRLRSRFEWGLITDIQPPDVETRLAILRKKAEREPTHIPDDVLEFIASHITNNIRELEGALNRVVAHGQLIGREITVEMAQDVLHDLLRQADRKVTVDEIQQRVAAHYNIKLAEMSSPRRARSVARPRQVAMYLAKQLTTLSLPQIGKRFGNRDHTTVMHAVRKIEELKVSDHSIAEDVELLKRQLQG